METIQILQNRFAVYDDKLVSGSGSGYNILQLSNNRFVVL